jgi:hypothetical protein
MRMHPRLKQRRGRFGATLTITSPANGATVAGSPAQLFTATAIDVTDGDISANVQWIVGTGSPAAVEATGASVNLSAFLAAGSPLVSNLVTAQITDSNGFTSTATITVLA